MPFAELAKFNPGPSLEEGGRQDGCFSADHDVALGVGPQGKIGDINQQLVAGSRQNGSLNCCSIRHNLVWIHLVADFPSSKHVDEQCFDLQMDVRIIISGKHAEQAVRHGDKPALAEPVM